MSTKSFPTTAVLGAYTGICLVNFSEIHEVADFFYPGIMTVGVAMMRKDMREIIAVQHPSIADHAPLIDMKDATYRQAWIDAEVARLGPALDLISTDNQSLDMVAFELESIRKVRGDKPAIIVSTNGPIRPPRGWTSKGWRRAQRRGYVCRQTVREGRPVLNHIALALVR